MTHYARLDAGWQVIDSSDGIRERPVGPKFPTPRAAIDYAQALDAVPHVRPVRATSSEPEPFADNEAAADSIPALSGSPEPPRYPRRRRKP